MLGEFAEVESPKWRNRSQPWAHQDQVCAFPLSEQTLAQYGMASRTPSVQASAASNRLSICSRVVQMTAVWLS